MSKYMGLVLSHPFFPVNFTPLGDLSSPTISNVTNANTLQSLSLVLSSNLYIGVFIWFLHLGLKA